MKTFNGISASPGIFIGKVFLYLDENPQVPKYSITPEEVPREIERFKEASEKASGEIHALFDRSSEKMGQIESRLLESHMLMLKDPEFNKLIENNLKDTLQNVEWILYSSTKQLIETLETSIDPYLRERTIDIHDVSKRIYNHLLFRDRLSLGDLQEEVVLVTHNLLPSDTIGMNKTMVRGIAMNAGGKTSHTAILARAFEIPAVLGLSNITQHAKSGDEVIIDGNSGVVILEPDLGTRKKYWNRLQEWQKRELQLLTLNELPAETRDGKTICMKANIELPDETESALAHGAEGIGLYRSEFLFLQPGGYSSEDAQYESYSRVLKSMEGKSVTIRTLDVGGDKVIPGLGGLDEKNPLLGWRAIRFCLSRIDLFKMQLRALLRASAHGKMKIMFPMISGIEEVDKIYEVLEEVKDECRKKSIPFDEEIPVGIMIEVPSAAMTSDILARKVDFFSIGTNDLIQYTIAVDRGNEKIAYLYEPFHPGVLRLIRTTIESAHNAGIEVGMCGEMAGDPIATVILLGLGLDEFSMSSFGIPEVKKIIRSVTIAEAEELVGLVMEMKSHLEVDAYVREWMNERFDFL